MSKSRTTPPEVGIPDVLMHYVVGKPLADGPVRRLPGESGTITWLVGAAPGPQLILRDLRPDISVDTARFAAAAHDHAARSGLAPPLLRNEAGDVLTMHNGRLYQVMRLARGEPVRDVIPDSLLCEELGRALGRLHKTLACLVPSDAAPRLTFADNPAMALEAAQAAHDHRACPHAAVRQAISAKLRRARALEHVALDALSGLPQQVIHGDVHPGNIFIQSPSGSHTPVVTMIDFDLARYAPPGYELMRALIYCVKPAGATPLFAGRAFAFLRGYFMAASLSESEIGSMVTLYETVQVLDPYGLSVCHGAQEALLRFGLARFSLLYWLHRNGSSISRLARQAVRASDHGKGCGS